MTDEQEQWFSEWFGSYWRHVAKAPARRAFARHVKTLERFNQVMTAVREQTPAMQSRPIDKIPHAASWLNAERWNDTPEPVPTAREKRSAIDEVLAAYKES